MFNRMLLVAQHALILLALLTTQSLAATPQQSLSLVNHLQSSYQGLQSLQFDFAQIADTNGRIREAHGYATFYRTSKSTAKSWGIMRWDYIEPNPQVILNNGQEIAIYTPQDKQLIISPVDDLESDITYAIFTGTKQLADEFTVHPPDPLFFLSDPPQDTEAVQLIPRQPHAQLKRVQLWVNTQHRLQRLLLEDHFGAITELTFSQVRFNDLPPQDSKQEQILLHLDLAPGTEIIRQ